MAYQNWNAQVWQEKGGKSIAFRMKYCDY